MLDEGRAMLARMRASADAWPEAADEIPRAQVLWALQYDHREDDLELVRWLHEREASGLNESSHGGLGEQGELVGFLLAGYRQVEDVWRHWAMKRANYDTWCGYDVEHLLAAGVEETLAYVRAADHPERTDLLERLADVEVDLDGWFTRRQSWFPADPAQEQPLTWIDRAELIGDKAGALEQLRAWAGGRPRDKETLGHLAFRFAELGAYGDAADARRDLAAYAEGAWDIASAQKSVAKASREAGRFEDAWAALLACRDQFPQIERWGAFGLGRSYVEELFCLARDGSGDLARQAFAAAEEAAPEVEFYLQMFEVAHDAALSIGRQDRAAHYQALADAKRRSIG